uniref:L-Fucosyltransferase n=1 Tax=Timema poppense TaxID=170557 RepID=A0A7R9DJU3_TIMPO|nr:unnamed protein product [Timema poppensis]
MNNFFCHVSLGGLYLSLQQAALLKYVILHQFIGPFVGQLKEEFKFRFEYTHIAQARLGDARARMEEFYGKRETLFVAVHVRRTDYIGYLSGKGVTVIADVSYYRHAVTWMLRKLISESKTSHNIAFILAGDDKVWCEMTLLPEIQKEIHSFGKQTYLGGSSVFYLGDIDTPVVDLVMLSSCNHSIIAYDTYGIWSALMANGWAVVYDITANNKPAENKLNAAMEFENILPNWIKMT